MDMERAVPPDAPDSNYRVARSLWIDRVPLPVDRVHRMRGEAQDLAAAAAEYAGILEAALGDPPRFDLVLLGMGPDGHIASLFPGHPAADETERLVVRVDGAPKPPPSRVTMTLPLLNAARAVAFVVSGAGKSAALARVLAGDASLPAARVEPLDGERLFLLDRAAAGEV